MKDYYNQKEKPTIRSLKFLMTLFLFLGLAFTQVNAVYAQDTDGDGILDSVDLDDDNDGIPDTVENDMCDNMSIDKSRILLSSECNFYVWHPNTEPHGYVTALDGNTSDERLYPAANSALANRVFMHFEFFDPVALSAIRISYHPSYGSIFNGGSQLRVYASNDDKTWTAVSNNFTPASSTQDIIPLNNTAIYKYYKIQGLSGSLTSNYLTEFNFDLASVSSCDRDGDGIPNSLDLDSDGDGLSDAFEAGATTDLTPNFQFTDVNGDADGLSPSVDPDGDGTVNYTITYADAIDETIIRGAVASQCNDPNNYGPLCDLDADGVPNYMDEDMDGDGMSNAEEGCTGCMSYQGTAAAGGANGSVQGFLILDQNGKYYVKLDNNYREISPANGYTYKGKILKSSYTALEGLEALASQFVILTEYGLYEGGGTRNALPQHMVPSGGFHQIPLPIGVLPSDVKCMQSDEGATVIQTYDGKLFVAEQFGKMGTNPDYTTPSGYTAPEQHFNWKMVQKDSSGAPFIAKDFSFSSHSANGNITGPDVIVARDTNGDLYTWGQKIFKGDGSAMIDFQRYPVQMTLPAGVTIRAYDVASVASNQTTYYIVGTDGKVYVLGANQGQSSTYYGYLGIGSSSGTQQTTTWINVKDPSGSGDLSNIVYLDGNGNQIGAIDNTGKLYLWGIVDGSASPVTLPTLAPGIDTNTPVAMYSSRNLIIKENGDICQKAGDDASFSCGLYPAINPVIPQLDRDLDNDGVPNCMDPAAAPVATITANDDDFTGTPVAAGGTTPTVFTNDDADGTTPATDALIDDNIAITADGGLTGVTINTDGTINIPATALAGNYTLTYQICLTADNTVCDTADVQLSVTAPDHDGDGITDSVDLDDDNDGITDAIEMRCDMPLVANPTSGDAQHPANGIYQEQVYLFNWDGADFQDGLDVGDTQTFNLPDGLTIVATVTAVGGSGDASTFLPTDMQTWSGASMWKLYNSAGDKEAFYTGPAQDINFTMSFTATKNGLPFPLDLLALDAEASGSGNQEDIDFYTNGEPWQLMESYGSNAVFTGVNTQHLISDFTDGNNNQIYYSHGATELSFELNSGSAGGKQAVAIGLWLICDFDNDAYPNYLDLDSDNDGISDLIESGQDQATLDTDNNGVLDSTTDDDNDGLMATADADDTDANSAGTVTPVDTDGDGMKDYLDLDAENDGIPDAVEAQPTNGYQGNDGDVSDDVDANGVPPYGLVIPENTDGADTPDYIDTDSDNDGNFDIQESGLSPIGTDANNDGVIDTITDANNDGADDGINTNRIDPDGNVNDPINNLQNTDSDNTDADYRSLNTPPDHDGDGITDDVDLDDDNDGIPDVIEYGNCTTGVEQTKFYEDFGTGAETDLAPPATTTLTYDPVQTNDGEYSIVQTPNPDAANFGGWISVPDHTGNANGRMMVVNASNQPSEMYRRTVTVTPNANLVADLWIINVLRSGSNGIKPDVSFRLEDMSGNQIGAAVNTGEIPEDETWHHYELSLNAGNNSQVQIVLFNNAPGGGGNDLAIDDITVKQVFCDHDSDGIADYLDLDSDNDGISDLIESGQDQATLDTDNNGVLDSTTDDDNDGLMATADADDTDANSAGTVTPVDTDGDGMEDYLDLDADNDGIPDAVEAQPTNGYQGNDGDVSDDVDANGVPPYGLIIPENTDGTDTPDYIDTDSDNDGNFDIQESGLSPIGTDANNDGVIDTITDANNDGADDGINTNRIDPDGNVNDPINNLQNTDSDNTDADYRSLNTPPDHDGDGIADDVDLDDDNDGIPDTEEGVCQAADVDLVNGTVNITHSTFDFSDSTNYISMQNPAGDPSPLAPDVFMNAYDSEGGQALFQYTFPNPVNLFVDAAGNIRVSFYYYDNIAGSTGNYNSSLSFNLLTDAGTLTNSYNFTAADISNLDAGHWIYITLNYSVTPNSTVVLNGFESSMESNTAGYGTTFNAANSEVYALAVEEIIACSGSRDTDGDGIADYLDLDSDNDGISDLIESGQDQATLDTDNNGVLDSTTDNDNDGLMDTADADDTDANSPGTVTPIDTDGDGVEDFIDLDADNDGIPDAVEAQPTNGYQGNDGDVSDDVDANGVPPYGLVIPENTDGTDTPDYIDTDSDNDGTDDTTESGLTLSGNDNDNDGIDDSINASYRDPDGDVSTPSNDLQNNDGNAIDADYRSVATDTDGDGIPDVLDLDDDNDGISDLIENCEPFNSQNTDGVWIGETPANLTVTQTNLAYQTPNASRTIANQYILNSTDVYNSLGHTNYSLIYQFDTPVKVSEIALAVVDIDFSFSVNIIVSGGTATTADFYNYGDNPADYNGATGELSFPAGGSNNGSYTSFLIGTSDRTLTRLEVQLNHTRNGDYVAYILYGKKLCDTDNDGFPNSVDLDSDNDGIYDIVEAGNGANDTNHDGRTDNSTGNNGLDDNLETDDTNNATINYTIPNTDGTGGEDYIDIDADDDGIVDNIEGQTTFSYAAPSGHDNDHNGVDDAYDTNGNWVDPTDTDGDNIPDYLDLDSDGDGDSDALEGWDTDNDGTPDTVPSGNDADGDGLDDAYDSDDNVINPTNGTTPTSYPNLDDPTSVELDWREVVNPEIEITKTATLNDTNGDGFANAGETIDYSFTVTNTGNVTVSNITVTDPLVTVHGGPISLNAGQSNSTTFFATYTITQADVDNGSVSNQATANGDAPSGDPVSAISDDPTTPAPTDPTVITLPANPEITVEKTAVLNDANGDGYANAGETISYNFKVENTGNVTVSNITITDALVTVSGGPVTLTPGQVDNTSFTATYTITQADVDNGSVSNQATANGTDPSGNNVTAQTDDPTTPAPTDPTVITLPANPEITVEKTAVLNDANGDGYADAGETISYSFTVENTGNVTVSNITITDALVTVSGGPVTLTPGQVDNTSFTATYTITQADVDNGSVSNQATANGTDPSGNNVTAQTDDPTTPAPTDPTVITLPQNPSIALFKYATINDLNGNGYVDAGETISYTFDVVNNGNVTLTNITISDPLVFVSGGPVSLNPGQHDTTTFTATYTITQDDIDNGEVTNQATASGEDPTGGMVTGKSDDPTNPTSTQDPTITTIFQHPDLTITKTAQPVSPTATVGDVVTYTLVVTNVGNVTLENIQVTDSNATPSSLSAGTLSPGSSTTLTVTHTITQSDMNNGTFTNVATASTTFNGNSVTAVSDDPNDVTDQDIDGDGHPDDPTVVDLTPNQVISIEAELDDQVNSTSGSPAVLNAGDTFTYILNVENTGNVDITPDTPAGYTYLSGDDNGDGVMNPGEVWSYGMEHTVTQSEVDSGQIAAQVTVTGTDATPSAGSVSDMSDDPYDYDNHDHEGDGEPDDETVTYIKQNPELTVTKQDHIPAGATVGDDVSYTIVVTNSGNVTLTNINVSDANATITSGTPIATLSPGSSATVTAVHTITQADMDNGGFDNVAVASSNFNGNNVEDSSDDPDTLTPDDPTHTDLTPYQVVQIEAELTDNIAGTPANDQALTTSDNINYTLTVTNPGNTSIIPSIDPLYTYTGGDTDGDGELDPGEVWTYTQTVPVTQADIDNGSIVAQTNVTGTGVNGTPAQDLSDDPEEAAGTDDPTVTGIIQTPELTVTKDDNIPTDASIGDVITYTIVVTNSGNVTLHDIVLTDSNAVISGNNTIATLSPGSFVTFTATHTITLSDMNNGSVSNSAVATGKDPQDNGVTDTSDDSNGLQPGGDDPTISDLTPYQQAELTAVLDDNDPSGPTNPSTYYEGDHINYDLFVENTGNVSIVPDTPLGYTPVTSGGVNVGDTNGDGLQDPGEVWQYTASHTLTQAEIDAGVYSTQVSVSGSFNGTTVTDNASDDPQTNADNDPTNTYFNLISEISITKVDQLPLFVMVGQDITYTITVNNNGNTTLSNVVVTDDNAVNITYTGGDTNGNNMLEPSETWTYTATHTITQSDMDAGAVANTAAVTSHNPQGDPVEDLQSDDTDTAEPNDPTVSDLHTYQNPAITTIKVVSNYIDNLPVGNTAGDVIEYDISVQNTGNITISNLQVIDLMVTNSGGTVTYTSGDTDGDNLLDVDETWHYTAVYTVTQSDIDSGEVENTAVGYGIDSNGTPLSDVSDSDPLVGTPEDPTVTTFVQEPRLEVTKQDVLPVQVSVGEYITYTIVVTNTGNVTLDNISVSDSNAVMNGVGSTPSLAPGDSVTFTAVHQITQEDMDSGMVSNQATATAEDTNGNTISDLSDDPDDNTDLDSEGDGDPDDITITDLTPYQVSSMASTLDDNVQTNANNPYNYNVGDDIVYTATLTNTGNVSITPVTPSGYTPVEQGGVNVGDTDGDGVLDPGETWIYTTTHTVTQSDIDAGHVDNQVTFEGTSATGSQVSDVSDDPQDMTTTTDDVTVTYIGQVSELTVIKTGVFSGSTPAAVGDVITYTITVTNTGNQTLTDIQVSDPNAVVTLPSVQVDLLPGESYDFTAIHTLTQSDIDAGMVENQATATGMDPSNQQVSDLSDDPSTGTPEDPTVISVPVHSELIITKTGIFDDSQQYGGNGDNYAQPGEYIVYTFEVINAGNQTISNITIDDSNLWAQGVSYTGGDINGNHLLDVGEVWTYSGIHVLTQSDIDAGMIENQATVNGEDPQGNTLTDLSDDPHDSTNDDSEGDGEPDDVTLTEVPQHPELSILKSGHFNDENGNGLADIGETISYTFVVSNIGNVTLHGVYVEDDLAGVEISGTPIILAPGESDNTTFTGVYVITASDIDNGFVVNTATVSGLTPQGVSVTDISDDPSNMNDVDSEGDGEPDDPTVIETLGLVITTIFTPNDDQTNDKWEIKGIQNFPHNQVKIYNRWGNLVYEKAHYMSDWDGYSNGRMVMESGKKLPVGTYYYIIDLGNGHEAFTGYLYLNR